jgi:hypothetical protein
MSWRKLKFDEGKARIFGQSLAGRGIGLYSLDGGLQAVSRLGGNFRCKST